MEGGRTRAHARAGGSPTSCTASAYLARLRKGWPGSGWRRCASRPRENAAAKGNAEKCAVRPVLHDRHPRERKRNAEADQPRPRVVAALIPGSNTDPDQQQWEAMPRLLRGPREAPSG